MANIVKLKRSAVPAAVPTVGQLDLGEVAINTYDGKMYIKRNNGAESVVQVGGGGLGSSPLTTKGDLYTFSTADVRLPVGLNGQVLVADSTQAVGIAWANPSVSTAAFDGGSASTTFSGVGSINLGGAI